MLLFLNCLIPICALIGMYCIAHKNKWGFVVFFVVEVSVGYLGYVTHQYGLIVTSAVYFLANIYSYIMWSKK